MKKIKAARQEKKNRITLKKLLAEYGSSSCSQERKKELKEIFQKLLSYSDSVLLDLKGGKK